MYKEFSGNRAGCVKESGVLVQFMSKKWKSAGRTGRFLFENTHFHKLTVLHVSFKLYLYDMVVSGPVSNILDL